MKVLLVIDRSAGGLAAMVWTAAEDDPRLLESKQFRGDAALKIWLAGIATRYGASNIVVKWTESLRSDTQLASLVQGMVAGSGPKIGGPAGTGQVE